MARKDRWEVEQPDASIEVSLFGNTIGWIFLFDLDKSPQQGAAAIGDPDHAPILLDLLQASIQLVGDADWQTILPFNDSANRWQVAKKKTPSKDGEFDIGGVVPLDDLPF